MEQRLNLHDCTVTRWQLILFDWKEGETKLAIQRHSGKYAWLTPSVRDNWRVSLNRCFRARKENEGVYQFRPYCKRYCLNVLIHIFLSNSVLPSQEVSFMLTTKINFITIMRLILLKIYLERQCYMKIKFFPAGTLIGCTRLYYFCCKQSFYK